MLFVCLCTIKAQDIITLQNGDEIKAKITKVSEKEIEYKKWDNPDGPIFTKEITSIFMIKYANGEKEVFANNKTTKTHTPKPSEAMRRSGNVLMIDQHVLTEDELKNIFDDKDIDIFFRAQTGIGNGRAFAFLGWVSTAICIGCAIKSADNPNYYSHVLGFGIAADILLPVGYIVSGINKGRISRLADKYNNGETNTFSLSLQPSLLRTHDNNVAPGLGLAISL